jgi:hypothetical protein
MTLGGPESVNAITITNGGRDVFTGPITTAGVGNSAGFIVDANGNVIFNPGSTLSDGSAATAAAGGGVFQVGVSSAGRFVAYGSSAQPTTITSETGIIGKLGSGNGMAQFLGATWTVLQSVWVGYAGTGVLDVYTGGQVNVGNTLFVGDLSGASGTVNVGSAGTVNAAGITVAPSAGSTGVINVQTGGTINDTGSLYVGYAGGSNGTIDVASVAQVAGSFYLGDATGAVGTGNLYSGGVMTVGSDAAIGSGNLAALNGTASLTIDAAATFNVGNRISISGGGTVNVLGGTVAANSLYVGMTGAGTLKVYAGSHINLTGFFMMASQAGTVGAATLFSGGAVTVAGSASIGSGTAAAPSGTASLTVMSASSFIAGSTLTVANGSSVDLMGGTVSAALQSGTVTVAAGGQITGNGVLATRTGNAFIDNGQITANGGTLQLNSSVSGTGSVVIDPNSTVAITGAALLTPTLTFMHGTGETLSLSSGADVTSIISGFGFSDQIAIAGIDSAVWGSSTDTLTLMDAGRTVGTLAFAGNYGNDVFSVAHSGNVGVITLHPG